MKSNPNETRQLALVTFVAMLVVIASSLPATGQGIVPTGGGRIAREGPPGTPCQGRCEYCVDGQCVPRQQTFGFYQTRWRRWPVEEPEIVSIKRPQVANPQIGPAAEVPPPHLEADVNPEFPHLRKQRPATGEPQPAGPRPTGPNPGGPPPVPDAPGDPFGNDLGQVVPLGPASPMGRTHVPMSRPVIPAEYAENLGGEKGIRQTDRPAAGRHQKLAPAVTGLPAVTPTSRVLNPLRLVAPTAPAVVIPAGSIVPLPKPQAAHNPLRSR